MIEDLEYKYGEGRTPLSLAHLGPRATHHLCAMQVTKPFVFGSMDAKDAIAGLAVRPEQTNFTPPGLDRILERNGAFYVSLKIDHEISNIMVLPKEWPQEHLRFGHEPGSYRMVYNVLLHGARLRRIVVQEPSQIPLWQGAFPEAAVQQGPAAAGCDVDALVLSARIPTFQTALRDFGRVRRGGYLFVEDVSFSFCYGAPDPGFMLPPMRGIVAANPDWFYAMTQDEWPQDATPDLKLLVVRRA